MSSSSAQVPKNIAQAVYSSATSTVPSSDLPSSAFCLLCRATALALFRAPLSVPPHHVFLLALPFGTGHDVIPVMSIVDITVVVAVSVPPIPVAAFMRDVVAGRDQDKCAGNKF